MNKTSLICVISTILILLGCEKGSNINVNNEQIITFSKNSPNLTELTSISKSLKNLDNKLLLKEDVQKLYEVSWVKQLRIKSNNLETIKIDIKEHQPIAILNKNTFLTQDGHKIKPKKVNLKLDLVSINGPVKTESDLLEVNHHMQSQMNRLNKSIRSIELGEDDSLRITTDDQLVIVMNLRNFRDQLKRLEDFISFELISGKIDLIKKMDLRYKKGLSISYLS